MSGLEHLQKSFESYFAHRHFPDEPATLYDPLEEFLLNSGKRIRPVMCLMGNELFGEVHQDAYHIAAAIELFHNFTLVHDDIMDKAPLRRGKPTVHAIHGEPTALLGGDVMMVVAYDYVNKIEPHYLKKVISLFNKTAKEVCEGQQYDMDYEKRIDVTIPDYIEMIRLKTAVLLAASLKTGAIIAGAGAADCEYIYQFGINIGLAFQLKDDLLDVYGIQEKFGKVSGGDIIAGKKTYLYLKALESAGAQTEYFRKLYSSHDIESTEKVSKVKEIFNQLAIEQHTRKLIDDYYQKALHDLARISLSIEATESLREYTDGLMEREN